MGRVKDKIAFITGGARGIGAESVRLLAKEGAKVIIGDILDTEGEMLAKAIGGKFIHFDVTSEGEWQELTGKLRMEYRKIDILFNNAGIIGFDDTNVVPQNPEYVSLDAWKHVHDVNLNGVFLGCKYGIALMKEHGASII